MNFTFEQTCGLTRFNIRGEFENAQNEIYFGFSEKCFPIFAFTFDNIAIGKMLCGFFYRQTDQFHIWTKNNGTAKIMQNHF